MLLDRIYSSLDWALGLTTEAQKITAGQMSLRAILAFLLAAMMIRIGNKRFMGKSTAMDVMLGIVFGSVISRAITGNAPFFPALCAGFALVLLHWVISAIAYRSHAFGCLVKGHADLLVENGELRRDAMKKSHITEADLREALRAHGKPPDFAGIASARLERNGDISILSR